jgi:hypothetical protein
MRPLITDSTTDMAHIIHPDIIPADFRHCVEFVGSSQ